MTGLRSDKKIAWLQLKMLQCNIWRKNPLLTFSSKLKQIFAFIFTLVVGGWWLCDYDFDSGLEFDFVWHQMLQEPWPEDDSEDRWLSQVADLIIIITIITIDLRGNIIFLWFITARTDPRLKLWPTSGRQEDCGWVPSSPSEHFNTWGRGLNDQYFSTIN